MAVLEELFRRSRVRLDPDPTLDAERALAMIGAYLGIRGFRLDREEQSRLQRLIDSKAPE